MAKKKVNIQTSEQPPAETVVFSIKGTDSNIQCRGFQFEVGKTHEVNGKIVACESGFHACPVEHHPLSVFEFYSPSVSRYWDCSQSGASDAQGNKLASAKITINAEISLGDLTKRAIDWVVKRANWKDGPSVSGANEAATASGDQGAAMASGYQGAATASGYQGAAMASGYQGAATASGYQGAAMASGDHGAATASGYHGAAMASGYHGAAMASGDHGAAMASGDHGAATASGYQGAAISTAPGGRVRGEVDGIDLFAREFEWRDGKWIRLSIACGTTGIDGIETGVWYIAKANKLVRAQSQS